MQTSLTYRTNRDLFSNYYLNEYLPETEAWDELSDDELREKRAEIVDLWEREKDTVAERTESSLEEKFIRPLFRKLGIPFEVEETVQRGQRRPDYGFFASEDAARDAFSQKKEGGDFYKNAVAVADAKRWGRPLDTRGSGEHKRDFENPSYQIHVYLQETPTRWAVLTDGKKWRLYYGPTSHRLDSYYEVDLPTILEQGDMEAFKYFYLFFRQEAFVEDATGDCFLDDVYDESNVFAEELGEDLQENIYEAIKILSEGFLQYPENDLDEEDLELIHDSSLIYLYRVIFVLYAEAEGRDLLDTDNEIYEQSYSLNSLKQEVAEELDSGNSKYLDWRDNLWSRLDELFKLIDQGSKSRGIPEEDLYIPAYNGGLFRTDPGEDGSDEAQFLANHRVGDSYLARVIELLTRSEQSDSGEKIFVDYSSLGVRNLGSVYEGLLEYQLNVADEPLALNDDGEYVSADEGGEPVIKEDEVYLTTDSGERKATGSYYTPEYVVEYIVENTLGPLVEDIRMDLAGQSGFGEGGFAEEFADRIFELKILDPAMGSGHFLTSAVDYLAREIIDAQEKQADQQGVETVNQDHDINWARRQVVQRCIYGVDLNPLAVELAKVSLWLRTLAAEQPLAFLDHHLKTGNSLVGSDIETVLDNGNPDSDTAEGQLTLQESFERTRQQALKHVTDQFEDLLAIDNETLSDIKDMETVYEDVRDDPLYQHLIGMANVHTAEQFGLDVPADAHERMAEALRDDDWATIEGQDWYRSAQQMAEDQRFFHWELEFPIAFYEQDGERKDDGGFDAVIGNPPYIFIDSIPENDRDYFRATSETWDYRYDIYGIFIEKGFNLLRDKGEFGYIIPHNLLNNDSFEDLRQFLLNEADEIEIIDFTDSVFEDASNEPMIMTARKATEDAEPILRSALIPPSEITNSDEHLTEYSASLVDELPSNPFLVRGGEWIGNLINGENTRPLGDSIHAVQGLRTGNNTERLSDNPTDPKHRPAIPGDDIFRYGYDWSGTYVLYDRELLSSDPAARPREKMYWESDEKILVQEIRNVHLSRRIVACIDRDKHIGLNTTNAIITRDDTEVSLCYIKAILSSSLMNEFFRCCFVDNHIATQYLESLPLYEVNFNLTDNERENIANKLMERYNEAVEAGNLDRFLQDYLQNAENSGSDDVVHDLLVGLVNSMIEMTDDLTRLNLNLLDYLEIPSDGLPESKAGETLGDLQMPVAGVADTPLVETTEAYRSLRIEGVSFTKEGGRVVLSADISYKIDEDDPRETDRWDRLAESEFETYEAMAFVGLSEAQQTLLREFVPVAVEEAGGFAGFRDNATKTNSPLDRLKALTLPDIDEVGAGLEQYVKVRERADELEKKIEKTDALIDEIVYDLYGLTDEEIEIVEEAVGE